MKKIKIYPPRRQYEKILEFFFKIFAPRESLAKIEVCPLSNGTTDCPGPSERFLS